MTEQPRELRLEPTEEEKRLVEELHEVAARFSHIPAVEVFRAFVYCAGKNAAHMEDADFEGAHPLRYVDAILRAGEDAENRAQRQAHQRKVDRGEIQPDEHDELPDVPAGGFLH